MGVQSLPFGYSFEYELGLMEKQIRMFAELVNAAPVVHPSQGMVGGLQSDSEFVIVSRQRLSELIEHLELEVGVMKCRIERLKN